MIKKAVINLGKTPSDVTGTKSSGVYGDYTYAKGEERQVKDIYKADKELRDGLADIDNNERRQRK